LINLIDSWEWGFAGRLADAFTPLSAARGHLKRNTATTAMAQGLFTNLHLRQLDKLD
jgi:hypothetical protein